MSFLRRLSHVPNTEIQLDREELVLGRDDTCDVTIGKYEGVSRQHCGFHRYKDGVVTVTDYGSRNGTFVNGRKVFLETRLKHNDVIRICTQVEFQFFDPDSTEAKVEARQQQIEAARLKRRVVVEGDERLSDALSEVRQELEDRDFGSLMSEILKNTARKPATARPPPRAKPAPPPAQGPDHR